MLTALEKIAKEAEGLGDDLVGLVLFGSAARGGHVPGRSDINLLVVLARPEAAQAPACAAILRRWIRRDRARVLPMTDGEVRAAVDVFPVEFGDMLSGYRVLAGRDPLAGLSPNDRNLRHQLEFEFRSKALGLRALLVDPPTGWFGVRDALAATVRRHAVSLVHLLRALRRLPGGETAAVAGWLAEAENIRDDHAAGRARLKEHLASLHALAWRAAELVNGLEAK